MKQLFIGLMSGTSIDALDAVLVDFASEKPRLLATHTTSTPSSLRQQLDQLCTPGFDEIHRLGQLDREIGELSANTVLTLLKQSSYQTSDIRAIGSHGQNIRHKPKLAHPFTLQIGDPNVIAAKTGITTIADFRRRDMALGGQGAPLAPIFHQYLFRTTQENRVVLNIGGIANLTWLPADPNETVIGFDTGPGNTLLDQWIFKHKQESYDSNGQFAASGQINTALLQKLLADDYFTQAYPKSTGREYFNLAWLEPHLPNNYLAQDIQATLTDVTAISICEAIQKLMPKGRVLICGGGIKNKFLLQRLMHHAKDLQFSSTSDYGLDPEWIEATAFAWLAKQTLDNLPGNLPSVTGASKASVLGGIFLK